MRLLRKMGASAALVLAVTVALVLPAVMVLADEPSGKQDTATFRVGLLNETHPAPAGNVPELSGQPTPLLQDERSQALHAQEVPHPVTQPPARFTGADTRPDTTGSDARPLQISPEEAARFRAQPPPPVGPGAINNTDHANAPVPWWRDPLVASAAAIAAFIAFFAGWLGDKKLVDALASRKPATDPEHLGPLLERLGLISDHPVADAPVGWSSDGPSPGRGTGVTVVEVADPDGLVNQEGDQANVGGHPEQPGDLYSSLPPDDNDSLAGTVAGHPEQPEDVYTPLPTDAQIEFVAQAMRTDRATLLQSLTSEEIIFLAAYKAEVRRRGPMSPPSTDPDGYIRFASLFERLHYPDDQEHSWFRWAMASALGWFLTREQAGRLGEGNLDVLAEIAGLRTTPTAEAYNQLKADSGVTANGPDRVYYRMDEQGNITKVFILEAKALGRRIGASAFNRGRNRGTDATIEYLKNSPNTARQEMGNQLAVLRRSGVPFETIAVGTTPNGQYRESFVSQVKTADGGVVMDDNGAVQEGSSWGAVLDMMPGRGGPGEAEVPPSSQATDEQ